MSRREVFGENLPHGPQWAAVSGGGRNMDVLAELFTTFIGLLSLSVIVFIIGMGAFFVVWFMKMSKPPADQDSQAGPGSREVR
jgi:hypothetical protein